MADSFSFTAAPPPAAAADDAPRAEDFAPAPEWPDDKPAAAEPAPFELLPTPMASALAALPSPQLVEEQLLERFQDQLEAVMEQQLGPLLAAGGALDPVLARKIARETSACAPRQRAAQRDART